MKKTITSLFTLCLIGSSALAQMSPDDFISRRLPDHLKEFRARVLGNASLSNQAKSNNSYDAPASIDFYDVDVWNNEILENTIEFVYTAGGQHRQSITYDQFMIEEYRTTINHTYWGDYSSIIEEYWTGTTWQFSQRVSYTYVSEGITTEQIYEFYNGSDWEFDYGYKVDYVGDPTRPDQAIFSTSDDGVLWTEDAIMNFTYNSGENKPHTLEISGWDDNYLFWEPFEKWEISNWGSVEFRPDYIINPQYGRNTVTDNNIGKIEPYFYFPADMIYSANFDFLAGEYNNIAKIESTYDQGNRTEILISEFNGVDYDSATRMDITYDPCLGYVKQIAQDYVSPGIWSINYGRYFMPTSTSYGTSCYVTAYDYFENFTDMSPSGTRVARYVINQNTSLNTEELEKTQIKIYPNPTNSIVSIEFDELTNGTLEIRSIEGKEFYSARIKGSVIELNVEDLPSGIYLVNIQTEARTFTKKLIRE